MIEVESLNNDQFLVVKETLTRMGVINRAGDTLYQSAHILHRRGRYYLAHFKQLIALDGKQTSMSESDLARLKKIAKILSSWKLVTLVKEEIDSPKVGLYIIPHSQKCKWNLQAKHRLGR
jgi:hypothetical protein